MDKINRSGMFNGYFALRNLIVKRIFLVVFLMSSEAAHSNEWRFEKNGFTLDTFVNASTSSNRKVCEAHPLLLISCHHHCKPEIKDEWGCQQSQTTSVTILTNCFFHSDNHQISTTLKFEDGNTFEIDTTLIDNQDNLKILGNIPALLAEIAKYDRVEFDLHPFMMKTETASFDTSKLIEAIQPIRQECGW